MACAKVTVGEIRGMVTLFEGPNGCLFASQHRGEKKSYLPLFQAGSRYGFISPRQAANRPRQWPVVSPNRSKVSSVPSRL
jgi:hypothetical protein